MECRGKSALSYSRTVGNEGAQLFATNRMQAAACGLESGISNSQRRGIPQQVERGDLQLDDVARRRDGTSRYLCKHVAPSSSRPASCLLAPHHLNREGATADEQTQTDQAQTQKAMEVKTLANVRSALETGTLIDLVPEQAGL